MHKRYFSDKIVKWYQANKRNLPWRETRDAYKIWLSEIILQQTRVNQGLPYYKQFITKYPTVKALAKAPEQEVLRLWQGLGYYTRARNLHKCAKTIEKSHNGKFPETFSELKDLPGIGDYTAAAIASIAFGEQVAVVDGNVFRVLSRIFGLDTVINSPEGKRKFSDLANELITNQSADLHNQAVMEFGALYCTPKNPNCGECIFRSECFAYSKNLQHELPVKAKPKSSRKRYFYYLVFEKDNALMMRKRVQNDIWHGLFDFHLIEKTKPIKIERLLAEDQQKKLIRKGEIVHVSKNYKHVLSHQIIHSKFIRIKATQVVSPPNSNLSFYSVKKIAKLPKPVLVSRFLSDHYLL